MNVLAYKPINWAIWDRSGQGKNILLTDVERQVWNQALPLQDKRHDTGHAEIVTYFALKLLDYFDDADRNVVVAAAILHDIGWSEVLAADRDVYLRPWSEEFRQKKDGLIVVHQEA